jgi:hypothetical protein
MIIPKYIIHYFAFVGFVILVSWNILGEKATQTIPVSGYRMVWNDEFSGSGLDLSSWQYYMGKRKDAFNSKNQVFVDSNGFLHLQAAISGDSVLAGMISTERLFESK